MSLHELHRILNYYLLYLFLSQFLSCIILFKLDFTPHISMWTFASSSSSPSPESHAKRQLKIKLANVNIWFTSYVHQHTNRKCTSHIHSFTLAHTSKVSFFEMHQNWWCLLFSVDCKLLRLKVVCGIYMNWTRRWHFERFFDRSERWKIL